VKLARDFSRHVREEGIVREGDGVVVAVSGGLDSVALLHLLRFAPGLPAVRLVAAHFDHAMREGSAADAAWVRGLARAWDVAFRGARADPAPQSEEEARRARYRFLEEVRSGEGARMVATAHQADDQAETVLFRALRGTGPGGLAGIPPWREPGIWRPLLPFSRAELEAYAGAVGLRWRQDPTNADEGFARNVIRRTLLPIAERQVAPGARRALARLARLARADEEAWRAARPVLEGPMDATHHAGAVSFERRALLSLHPALRARLLRSFAHDVGGALDEAGTRAALEFTSSGASGGRVELTGGLVLERSFERCTLRGAAAQPPPERVVEISAPGEGHGEGRAAGRRFSVTWTRASAPPERWIVEIPLREVTFPLRIRGWRPGDRIRLPYGTKALGKLLAEHRIPAPERPERPVAVDADGRVLWVPGIARAVVARGGPDREVLRIGISYADDD